MNADHLDRFAGAIIDTCEKLELDARESIASIGMALTSMLATMEDPPKEAEEIFGMIRDGLRTIKQRELH